jgi:hypothetical protein
MRTDEDKYGCEDCIFEFFEEDPYGCPLVDNNELTVKEWLDIVPHLKKITRIIGCVSVQRKA